MYSFHICISFMYVYIHMLMYIYIYIYICIYAACALVGEREYVGTVDQVNTPTFNFDAAI